MKLKDVASQYGFDQYSFEVFIYQHCKVPLRLTGFSRNILNDEDVPAAVEAYREYLKKQEELEARKRRAVEDVKRRQNDLIDAAKSIILTTCPQVDGYRATKQLGLVFGECFFKSSYLDGITDMIDLVFHEQLATQLVRARNAAVNRLVQDAVNRGANAVIGIDSEHSSSWGYMHITISGTAVWLDPVEEKD